MERVKRLVREAHRRSLWQVLGVYLAGSWVALEVVGELTESLGLPDWVPPFAVVLLVIGLPIVVATAVVQEGASPGATAADRDEETAGPGARRDAAGEELAAGGEAARRVAPADAVPEADSETTSTVPPGALETARAPGGSAGEPGALERGGADAEGTLRRLLTWRKALLGGVLAFALLGVVTAGYMAMRTLGIGPVGTLVAKGVLGERDPILLADFENRTGDSLLSQVVTEALRVDLSQSPTVRLAGPAFVKDVRERMQVPAHVPLGTELAREAAEREGIKAVLAGEIGVVGTSFLLSARLLAPETGEILASQRETAVDSTQLVAAIDRLSRRLRERIGESLKSIRSDPPLARVTTASLDALRKYSQAVRAIESEGEEDRGIALLEEAVALDTAFAMAWRKLGVALANRGEERARQVEALETAMRHGDRLTERERYLTEAAYHVDVTDDVQKAMTAYRNLLDLDPRDPWALNNLGLLYDEMRDHARAEELYRRAIEADSGSSIPYLNTVVVQVAQGEFEEAWETLAVMERRFPGNPRVGVFRVQVAAAEGDYGKAEEHARALRDAHGANLFFRQLASQRLASVDAVRGRLAEGEEHFDDALAAVRERGSPAQVLGVASWRVWGNLLVRRDTAGAVAWVARMLEEHPLAGMDPLDRPYVPLAEFYAFAGRPDRARAILEEWEREVPPAQRRGASEEELRARGAIAIAEGRYDDALDAFRRSDRGECLLCALPGLAIAHDLAGNRDSAIAGYERFLETPAMERLVWDQGHLARSLERLGALHEEAGNPEEALRYYRRFVELWEDADPELQPRVERARERIAALTGAGIEDL